MSTLYLVPTPLGDPDDIAIRALRIFREVGAITCPDDAQFPLKLVDLYQIQTQIIAYSNALEALESGDLALVAPSGTPGIGDAAQGLVREAIRRGVRVEALPGASAEITALVLSGLPTEAFVYIGALPDDLSGYAREHDTLIFVTEDVTSALERLSAAWGERRVCVASRLTLPDEVVYRGVTSDALAYLREQPIAGEAMLVVEGAPPEIAEVWDEARVWVALRERLGAGEAVKQAAKAVAGAAGWDRRVVYGMGVEEKGRANAAND